MVLESSGPRTDGKFVQYKRYSEADAPASPLRIAVQSAKTLLRTFFAPAKVPPFPCFDKLVLSPVEIKKDHLSLVFLPAAKFCNGSPAQFRHHGRTAQASRERNAPVGAYIVCTKRIYKAVLKVTRYLLTKIPRSFII